MAKPTDEAKFHFSKAKRFADTASGHYMGMNGASVTPAEMGDRTLSAAVRELGDGLDHLATGLRATYLLLAEVKTLLERPGR